MALTNAIIRFQAKLVVGFKTVLRRSKLLKYFIWDCEPFSCNKWPIFKQKQPYEQLINHSCSVFEQYKLIKLAGTQYVTARILGLSLDSKPATVPLDVQKIRKYSELRSTSSLFVPTVKYTCKQHNLIAHFTNSEVSNTSWFIHRLLPDTRDYKHKQNSHPIHKSTKGTDWGLENLTSNEFYV